MRTVTKSKTEHEENVSTFSRSHHHDKALNDVNGRLAFVARMGPHEWNTSRKRFLSDVEIETGYGISRKTLRNWRLLGKGPTWRKFGRGVKYDVHQLELWIDSLPTGGAGVPSSAVKSA